MVYFLYPFLRTVDIFSSVAGTKCALKRMHDEETSRLYRLSGSNPLNPVQVHYIFLVSEWTDFFV